MKLKCMLYKHMFCKIMADYHKIPSTMKHSPGTCLHEISEEKEVDSRRDTKTKSRD